VVSGYSYAAVPFFPNNQAAAELNTAPACAAPAATLAP
jgi:hypothetical protein